MLFGASRTPLTLHPCAGVPLRPGGRAPRRSNQPPAIAPPRWPLSIPFQCAAALWWPSSNVLQGAMASSTSAVPHPTRPCPSPAAVGCKGDRGAAGLSPAAWAMGQPTIGNEVEDVLPGACSLPLHNGSHLVPAALGAILHTQIQLLAALALLLCGGRGLRRLGKSGS